MAGPTGAQDTLLNLLHLEKETLWTQLAHLPIEERQRCWAFRAAQLNSALSNTPPVPRLDLGGPKDNIIHNDAIRTDAMPLISRRRSVQNPPPVGHPLELILD